MRSRLAFLGSILLVLVPGLLTLPHYGITSDEPIYMRATSHIEDWLRSGARGMDCDAIASAWKTEPLRNVHPSGLKWLYVAAHRLIRWEPDPYRRVRLWSLGLFSVAQATFAWTFLTGARRRFAWTVLLLSMPRLFAHLHFAATDIPLTSLLLLLASGLERLLFGRWFWILGLGVAFASAIKFTALLLLVPLFAAFLLRFRERRGEALVRLALVGAVGMIAFWALNPDWWCAPIASARAFLHQSTTRLRWTPISVVFAGRLYTVRAPWYYPFAMFAITTPLLHLGLLAAGFLTLRRSPTLPVVLVMAASLFLIMTTPLSPTNDGVRYLIPSFPFLAVVMVWGLEAWWRLIRTEGGSLRRVWRVASTAALASLAFLACLQLVHYHPYELSYYNELVGGLRGAYARGFEVTYWWEPLDDEVLGELNRSTAGKAVYFPVLPTDHFFRHLAHTGRMAFRLTYDLAEAEYVFVMARPSAEFWEERVRRDLPEGVRMRPEWEVALDGIALLRLWAVDRPDSGRGSGA